MLVGFTHKLVAFLTSALNTLLPPMQEKAKHLREALYYLLEDPGIRRAAHVVSLVIFATIIVSIVGFVLGFEPGPEKCGSAPLVRHGDL